jgi:hypothetical protein
MATRTDSPSSMSERDAIAVELHDRSRDIAFPRVS